MSLEELTARSKIHNRVKLFIKEKRLNVTLDEIVYGKYKYNLNNKRVCYPNCTFIVYNKERNYHYFIRYFEVEKYFRNERSDNLKFLESVTKRMMELTSKARRCGKNFIRINKKEKKYENN